MESPSAEELCGRILAGRYRVERLLRRGGMGAVYVGQDLQTDRSVALKLVRQSLIDDPQAIARFKREARLATEVAHENIVECLDAGDDGGLLYIVMELLSGTTLREHLETRGRLPWQETLPIVEQTVRALGVAHGRGIVHRDLKPENVMFVGQSPPRVKLLDFGVAKQARMDGESNATQMTGTGFVVGTPGYVAPEVVLEGRSDDPRSDLYALGVMWFELLTGQKPFTAKTPFALAMRHAHEQAPSPSSLLPFSPVPVPVERLVLQLMAKAPEERPGSADELLARIENLASESQRALASVPTTDPGEPTMTDADFHPGRTQVAPWSAGKTPRDAFTPARAADPSPAVNATPATLAQQRMVSELLPGTSGTLGPPRSGRTVLLLALFLGASILGGVVTLVVVGKPRADGRLEVPSAAPSVAPSDEAALVMNRGVDSVAGSDRLLPAVAADDVSQRRNGEEDGSGAASALRPEASQPHGGGETDGQPRADQPRADLPRGERQKAPKEKSGSDARLAAAAAAALPGSSPYNHSAVFTPAPAAASTNAPSSDQPATSPSPSTNSPAPATLKIRPTAAWKIGLDGEAPREAQRPPTSVAAGAHTITFESTENGRTETRVINLMPGSTVTLREPSSIQEAGP